MLPHGPDAVCPRLPARHSFRRESKIPDDFGGQNTEAPPLPVSSRFSRFGTVSDWTHLQGLSPLSWLSFSLWAFWAQHRSRSRVRFRLLPGRKLPTQARLNEQESSFEEKFHSPSPLDGICTRFESRRLRQHLPKAFDVAPIQEPSFAYRIERRDYSVSVHLTYNASGTYPGLRRRAPVELEEPLSWRIQLYGPAHSG